MGIRSSGILGSDGRHPFRDGKLVVGTLGAWADAWVPRIESRFNWQNIRQSHPEAGCPG